jgi:hypothetical protein
LPYINQTAVGGGSGAMTLITNTVLGVAAASFDFQNIVGTFNHLRLLTQLRDDSAGTGIAGALLRFNNDSGANYNIVQMQNVNATVTGTNTLANTSGAGPVQTNGGATASYFGIGTIDIPFYAKTTAFKAAIVGMGSVEAVAANTIEKHCSSVWKNTAAITRVTILPGAGSNFVAGSAVSLYGVT